MDKKRVRFTMAISDADIALIRKAAAKEGRDVSSYVRFHILQHVQTMEVVK